MQELTLKRVLWAVSTNTTGIGSIIDRLSGGKQINRTKLSYGEPKERLIELLDDLADRKIVLCTRAADGLLYRKITKAQHELEAQLAKEALR